MKENTKIVLTGILSILIIFGFGVLVGFAINRDIADRREIKFASSVVDGCMTYKAETEKEISKLYGLYVSNCKMYRADRHDCP